MLPMLSIGPKAHNIDESTYYTSKEDTPTLGKDTLPSQRVPKRSFYKDGSWNIFARASLMEK